MRQYFLFFLIIAFSYTSDCNSQNIDSIRGTSWISLDYIRDMENYLPCECFDSINYYFYISIAPKFIDKDIRNDEQMIPEGVLHQVIQTEPTQFYILDTDSAKYVISVDSKLYYFNANHLGSGSLITDGSGDTYQTLAYAPFGETLVNQFSGDYDEPYKFGGHIKDNESNLYYMGARYNDPNLSIEISTDNKWYLFPHLTPYNSMGNNPIANIDADGNIIRPWNQQVRGSDGYLINGFNNHTAEAKFNNIFKCTR